MPRISRIVVVGLALCLVAGLGMGAADAGARFNDLTAKLMCTCGCGQTLATCNHLGCSSLAREGGELKTAIARGDKAAARAQICMQMADCGHDLRRVEIAQIENVARPGRGEFSHERLVSFQAVEFCHGHAGLVSRQRIDQGNARIHFHGVAEAI